MTITTITITIDSSADESNNDDGDDLFSPKKSYDRISSEYNSTKKNLREIMFITGYRAKRNMTF